MDLAISGAETSYVSICSACGRTFSAPGPFQNHSRGCQPNKKRLRKTLTAAKDVIARKRQRRVENTVSGRAELVDGVVDVSSKTVVFQNSELTSTLC